MQSNRVRNVNIEMLSNFWGRLKKVTYDYFTQAGFWQTQVREIYDKGDGAAILLYNQARKTVVLIRQFRAPALYNGHPSGLLIETCAGLLEAQNPEECIKKEAQEETGYQIQKVQPLFSAYMTPGAVTENLHFFLGEYTNAMKIHAGGGLAHEQEEIEVLEIDFESALAMIETGEICDAKTIILLQHIRIKGIM
jgi:nudix-type nucleoside diphosphatase (YffH/AdpP family)